MNYKVVIFIFSVALIFQGAQSQAFAAGWSSGGESSSSSSSSYYNKGKREVDSQNYKVAINHLKKVIEKDSKNADAYNLLGYSYRKSGQTEQALLYYKKALAINPNHLGANEYLGELYLETDQLEKAEERLKILGNACVYKCEEYDDLKVAVEKYKAREKNNGD